jgi:hypothetical protein
LVANVLIVIYLVRVALRPREGHGAQAAPTGLAGP